MAIRSAAARLRAALARGREPVAGERDELIHTRRILDAIEEYVYVGEILPGDGYRVLFQGPCRAVQLPTTVANLPTCTLIRPSLQGV